MANGLIAALVSCCLAFAGNRIILKYFRRGAVLWLVPVLEEVLKTLISSIANASVLWTHAFFGMLEGLWDLRGRNETGVQAALVSIGGHLAFGYLTYAAWQTSGSMALGILAASLVHTAWNYLVLSRWVKEP